MNKDKLERLKRESREVAAKNVLERGSVHFRLDPEMMSVLVDEANKVRVPFGVFARMLMIEALTARLGTKELPETKQTQSRSRMSVKKPASRKFA